MVGSSYRNWLWLSGWDKFMLFPLANYCLLNSSTLCSKYSCVSIITYFCIIPVRWFLLHMLLTFSHEYSSCTAVLCSHNYFQIMPGIVSISFHVTKLLYAELLYTILILLSLHPSVVLAFKTSPFLWLAPICCHKMTRFCCSSYLHATLPSFPDMKSEPICSFPVSLGNTVFIIGQD